MALPTHLSPNKGTTNVSQNKHHQSYHSFSIMRRPSDSDLLDTYSITPATVTPTQSTNNDDDSVTYNNIDSSLNPSNTPTNPTSNLNLNYINMSNLSSIMLNNSSQRLSVNSNVSLTKSITNNVFDDINICTLDEEYSDNTSLYSEVKLPDSFIKTKNRNYSINVSLKNHGYIVIKTIEKRKYGFVYYAKQVNTNTEVIIKTCSKSVYRGNTCMAKQNIIHEGKIMKFIQHHNPPKNFIKCLDFFYDDKFIFLVQQFGGINMFEYIKSSHEMIKDGEIPIQEWKRHCKILIKQILLYINWMHNHVFLCHLDISLENMVINNVEYDYHLKKFTNHGNLSIIDFDYSEVISPKTEYKCSKFVGKLTYMSPKLYQNKPFNAKKNDIWGLGVCIYIILTGNNPYQKPSMEDPYFGVLYIYIIYFIHVRSILENTY